MPRNNQLRIAPYVQPQQQQNKKKKGKATKMAYDRINRNTFQRLVAEGAYKYALLDPFNEKAIGARVPDLYSGHTTTMCIKRSLTLNSNASGIGSIMIMPNLVYTGFSPSGTISGATNFLWGDGTTLTAGVTLGPSIGGVLDSYRIVGMGVQVTSIASSITDSGKVCFATYPVSSYIVGRNAQTTVGGQIPVANPNLTANNTIVSWNTPANGATIDYSALVQFPGAEVFGVKELANAPIEITPRMCDPAGLSFRHTGDDFLGYDVPGGASISGNSSYLQLNGFEMSTIAFTGCTASTGVLDIEIIYHLEGTPAVTAGVGVTGGGFIGGGSTSPSNWNLFVNTISKAAASPTIRRVGMDLLSSSLGSQGAGAMLRIASAIRDEL